MIVDTAFCMDGLKNKIRQSPDPFTQNRFYNGWKHEHWIVNLFIFTPDGKIVMAGLNCPGSFHDSKVARELGIYDTLQDLYATTGAKTVVDSAFLLPDEDMFYKSGQSPQFTGNVDRDVLAVAISSEATSFRQCSEWGMRAVQGTFPRIKDFLYYEEEGERGRILLSICLIYNLRCARVGQNQLRTVFNNQVEDLLPPDIRNEYLRRQRIDAERQRRADALLQRSIERRARIIQDRASRRQR